jgi:hypothetical protein
MEEPWRKHGQTMEEVPLNPLFIEWNFMAIFKEILYQTVDNEERIYHLLGGKKTIFYDIDIIKKR